MLVRSKIRIKLVGPILSQAQAGVTIGFDAVMRKTDDGRCLLPGTLLKGKLREAAAELAELGSSLTPPIMIDVEDLFGPLPVNERGEEDPTDLRSQQRRGRLRFTVLQEPQPRTTSADTLYRIRIDEETRTVATGAYQVIESLVPSGEAVDLVGQVEYQARSDADRDTVQRVLQTLLAWIPQYGAERTVGFGQVAEFQVEDPQIISYQSVSSDAQSCLEHNALMLELSFAEPFCVGDRLLAGNTFVSDEVISGGVVRGALATSLQEILGLSPEADIRPHRDRYDPLIQPLVRHFNEIRFGHARPAEPHQGNPESELAHVLAKRPVQLPLSLFSISDSENERIPADMALASDEDALAHADRDPRSQSDWKRADSGIRDHFGWPHLNRETRVRTAIDSQRRKARESALFAYECIIPGDCRWYCPISLGGVAEGERQGVVDALQAFLAGGVGPIGKTKTTASARLLRPSSVPSCLTSSFQPLDGNRWVLTLQTPALLCDPQRLPLAGNAQQDPHQSLHEAYAAVWTELSEHLELESFYASQRLVGGYLVRRYQHGRPYFPFLLTEAGSVFVVKLGKNTEDASSVQDLISTWAQTGLPIPDWAGQRYGSRWDECPFLPEDGFGEIAVNLECHSKDRMPSAPA